MNDPDPGPDLNPDSDPDVDVDLNLNLNPDSDHRNKQPTVPVDVGSSLKHQKGRSNSSLVTPVTADVANKKERDAKSACDPRGLILRPGRQSFIEKARHRELSLFEEAVEATLMSASSFALADLRSLAYKQLISPDDAVEVLKLPMTGGRLRELQVKHNEFWKTFKSRDFTSNADAYLEKYNIPNSAVVHYIGDERADTESVHYIGRNHYRGHIMLTFRGSVTNNDWVQDFKLMISKVPNPMREVEGQPDTVGIHLGFTNFVSYGESHAKWKIVAKQLQTKSDHHVSDDEQIIAEREDTVVSTASELNDYTAQEQRLSKMETIILQLREMKRQYPHDPIFISGHSLGGALALIAALGVCADPLLGKLPPDAPPGLTPVTCYTVGNPKPGDGDFCKAMDHLERTKKLRCCVIHNTWDVVPMLATNMAGLESGFWHPGWKILLYKDRCEIGRSREGTSQLKESAINPQYSCACCRCCCCRLQDSQSMWNTMPKRFNVMRAAKNMTKPRVNKHDHRVYLERLMAQQNYLRGVQLNDLYFENTWKEEYIINDNPLNEEDVSEKKKILDEPSLSLLGTEYLREEIFDIHDV